MNVCWRSECQTTAGCAHRGPHLEMCWFPEGEGLLRAVVIEECARVSLNCRLTDERHAIKIRQQIAAAIRAQKDRTYKATGEFNDAIEQCARVADKYNIGGSGIEIADAIRALKNK